MDSVELETFSLFYTHSFINMYVDLYLRFLGNPRTQIFGIVVKLGAARCNKSWVRTLIRPVHCTPNDDDDVVDTAPVQSLVGTSVGSP